MKNFIFFCELPPQNKIVGRPWFLAKEIKKRGYKVFYFALSPIFYRYFEEKKNISQKFFDILKITHYHLAGIEVFSFPVYFPRRFLSFHRINYTLFLPLIFNRFKSIFKKSIIFVNNLLWFWTLKKVIDNSVTIIYDRADDLEVFYPYKKIRRYYEKLEELFLKKVKLSLAVSKEIENELKNKYPFLKILFLPNGVPEEWSLILPSELENFQVGKNLKKPVIGFIGSLFQWVDLDLIEKCLQNFPEATFILIGPHKGKGIKKLSKYSNILLLGAQPYSSIPLWVNIFDICIIPFKKEKVSYKADPIKLYEYLALGKPVVSTIEWQSDNYLKDLIYVGRDEKEFIEKIEIALKENNSLLCEKRKDYILKNHTWKKRVDTLLNFIKNENRN